ncbi:MAG TPA: ABC transporter permease [Cytophagales bacterium]|nr:ABC transporter permease [Cytophagales bacterium]
MLSVVGKYFMFIGSLFINRERPVVYVKRIVDECILIGTDSVFIVTIVSLFIGAVSGLQTAHNLISPMVPLYTVGVIVRDMTILELAPTITCIVLAGKVGSNIAGGLGTMRITEQVDAMDVMGINSASYLVLPKIVAAMLTFPMLVTMAGFLSLFGGYLSTVLTGLLSGHDYVYGIRYQFLEYNIFVAIVKSIVFAYLISSVSSFMGYYTKGGALEVGQSSTIAVTNSCIAVLLADYFIAELLF